MTKTREPTLFVCYAKEDDAWRDRVRAHMGSLARDAKITCWDDTCIGPGSPWEATIAGALEAARVAVLLVSADFMASEFIHAEELPKILRASEEKRLLVFPLCVSAASLTPELKALQFFNDLDKPLNTISRGEAEKILAALADRVAHALGIRGDGVLLAGRVPWGGERRSAQERVERPLMEGLTGFNLGDVPSPTPLERPRQSRPPAPAASVDFERHLAPLLALALTFGLGTNSLIALAQAVRRSHPESNQSSLLSRLVKVSSADVPQHESSPDLPADVLEWLVSECDRGSWAPEARLALKLLQGIDLLERGRLREALSALRPIVAAWGSQLPQPGRIAWALIEHGARLLDTDVGTSRVAFEFAVELARDDEPLRADWLIQVVDECLSYKAYEESEHWCNEALKLSAGALLESDRAAIFADLGFAQAIRESYSEALRSYDEAARLVPQHPEYRRNAVSVLLGRATLALARDDLEEAQRALDDALKRAPDNADTYSCLGALYEQQHRFEDAFTAVAKAFELQPETAVHALNLAHLSVELHRFEEAERLCTEVLKRDARLPEAHNIRGCALQHLERDDAALTEYERAAELDPGVALYARNAGLLCAARGDTSGAERWLRRTLALKREDDIASFELGMIFLRRRDYDEALSAFCQASAYAPTVARYWLSQADVHVERRAWPDADACVRRVLAIEPNSADGLGYLGFLREREHRYGDALRAYTLAAEEDARNPDLAEAVGWMHEMIGSLNKQPANFAEAATWFERALELDSKRVSAINGLAIISERHGELEGALALFERAVALEPDNGVQRHNLAWILRRMRRYSEATAAFREALRVEPNSSENYSGLAWALWEGGIDGPEAVAMAGRAAELDPKSPSAAHTLGTVLLGQSWGVAEPHLKRWFELAASDASWWKPDERRNTLVTIAATINMGRGKALAALLTTLGPHVRWRPYLDALSQVLESDPVKPSASPASTELGEELARAVREQRTATRGVDARQVRDPS